MKSEQQRILEVIEHMATDNDLEPTIQFGPANAGTMYFHGPTNLVGSFAFKFNTTYVVLNKVESADQLAMAYYHDNGQMVKFYAQVEELILSGIR
jgi:hypothetical protein